MNQQRDEDVVMQTDLGMNMVVNDDLKFYCELCKLSATSQIVLDAHLKGSRHAKELKKKNIIEGLKVDTETTDDIKCNVCNLHLNSVQQLQTHIEGNRHKKKMAKGDWTGKEIISKSKRETEDEEMPLAPVTAPLLLCEPCNKFFNSQSQMDGHLVSAKHLKKVNLQKNRNGIKNDKRGHKIFKKNWHGKKKGSLPYKMKFQSGSNDAPSIRPSSSFFPVKNFISGGVQNFNMQ